MRNETKATKIPRSVKLAVYARDHGCCVICGCPGLPEAHIVKRSQGGKGVEQNIVTLCRQCHRELDEGRDRKTYLKMVIDYISELYPGWSKEQVIYKKGDYK